MKLTLLCVAACLLAAAMAADDLEMKERKLIKELKELEHNLEQRPLRGNKGGRPVGKRPDKGGLKPKPKFYFKLLLRYKLQECGLGPDRPLPSSIPRPFKVPRRPNILLQLLTLKLRKVVRLVKELIYEGPRPYGPKYVRPRPSYSPVGALEALKIELAELIKEPSPTGVSKECLVLSKIVNFIREQREDEEKRDLVDLLTEIKRRGPKGRRPGGKKPGRKPGGPAKGVKKLFIFSLIRNKLQECGLGPLRPFPSGLPHRPNPNPRRKNILSKLLRYSKLPKLIRIIGKLVDDGLRPSGVPRIPGPRPSGYPAEEFAELKSELQELKMKPIPTGESIECLVLEKIVDFIEERREGGEESEEEREFGELLKEFKRSLGYRPYPSGKPGRRPLRPRPSKMPSKPMEKRHSLLEYVMGLLK